MTEFFTIDAGEAIEQITMVLVEADIQFICEVYAKVCNPKCRVTMDKEIEIQETT